MCILYWGSNMHLSPTKVFEITERQFHNGPSEIVHIEDYKDGKQILAIYKDKWISCYTIENKYLFFWKLATGGGAVAILEVDSTIPVDYILSMTGEASYKIYGVVNDKRIKRVEIEMSDGSLLNEDQFYDGRLFLILHENMVENRLDYEFIRGYDDDNQLIYEKEI